jgi:hypothetical protein
MRIEDIRYIRRHRQAPAGNTRPHASTRNPKAKKSRSKAKGVAKPDLDFTDIDRVLTSSQKVTRKPAGKDPIFDLSNIDFPQSEASEKRKAKKKNGEDPTLALTGRHFLSEKKRKRKLKSQRNNGQDISLNLPAGLTPIDFTPTDPLRRSGYIARDLSGKVALEDEFSLPELEAPRMALIGPGTAVPLRESNPHAEVSEWRLESIDRPTMIGRDDPSNRSTHALFPVRAFNPSEMAFTTNLTPQEEQEMRARQAQNYPEKPIKERLFASAWKNTWSRAAAVALTVTSLFGNAPSSPAKTKEDMERAWLRRSLEQIQTNDNPLGLKGRSTVFSSSPRSRVKTAAAAVLAIALTSIFTSFANGGRSEPAKPTPQDAAPIKASTLVIHQGNTPSAAQAAVAALGTPAIVRAFSPMEELQQMRDNGQLGERARYSLEFALKGFSWAKNELADGLLNGRYGVPKNLRLGAELIKELAASGDKGGILKLAFMETQERFTAYGVEFTIKGAVKRMQDVGEAFYGGESLLEEANESLGSPGRN